ncbi:hypothetical protein Arub01_11590 [Actinomadura rubrobrunea]|uniref:Uncharacterized protein n=1 Tax=Actinomadura rubrobrunea TaxID=115335 RepID=A0A9W6UVQ7_9ACTN|nr:hypothetical protein [Actinomadura rubrobrunea]GLW62915.1 hypothetical protein Arub01_11590 [Actinomadura rubrobrunea]
MLGDESDLSANLRGLGPFLGFVMRVLASAGVLTAVLYYFGYTRAEALYGYFGVNLGSLGYTTTDYLVHSAGPLFAPLTVVLIAGVVAIIAHHVLVLLLDRLSPKWRRVVCTGLVIGALVLLAIGAIGLQHRARVLAGPIFSPVALGVGALLLIYATENAWIRANLPDQFTAASTRPVRRGLLVGLALIAAFWATAGEAQRQGEREAQAIEMSLLVRQPKAIVFSRERLQIGAPGVRMVRLAGGEESAYAFRYDGLHTLAHTRGRWFLLPSGWRRGNGTAVILLRDYRDDIRVDLAP